MCEDILRLQLSEISDWLMKKKCEDILRPHLSEVYDWILKKNRIFWATTMRGLWLVSGKKLCDDILRLHLSEVFDYLLKKIEDIVRLQLNKVFVDRLVKKNWRHSEFTSERGLWKKYCEKIEDILRLQLCEVYHWLVKKCVKTIWRSKNLLG